MPLDPGEFVDAASAIERQVAGVIVGQTGAIRGTLISLIAGGHALLEGVPGLGKTTLARAFAAAIGLSHSRIQFTPDLMPADITGTTVLVQEAAGTPRVEFQPGPVFAGLVLADEINRASPRTQSALLEAMQEGTVTIAGSTHTLPRPFCVLATQNPIELQGTYPLPEAQLDRFFLKLRFEYPSEGELERIIAAGPTAAAEDAVEQVADAELLLRMNALARSVPAASHVLDYVARLLLALQPSSPEATPLAREYVRLGPSPRGGQALSLAGRVAALLDGRHNLAFEDVRTVAPAALRHRLALSFDAERQAIAPEAIIAEALERVPEENR
ncbi:MAG TPA: MoxR family ATPase [Solirubrobacteraceae bacterium]|nr:MoxR family ATPase [Solirubrobacteraceae bacterium]